MPLPTQNPPVVPLRFKESPVLLTDIRLLAPDSQPLERPSLPSLTRAPLHRKAPELALPSA